MCIMARSEWEISCYGNTALGQDHKKGFYYSPSTQEEKQQGTNQPARATVKGPASKNNKKVSEHGDGGGFL